MTVIIPKSKFIAIYQSLSTLPDIEIASKKHGYDCVSVWFLFLIFHLEFLTICRVCYNSILSIYSQKKQKQAKQKVPQYRNGPQLVALYQRYSNGETLLSIASSIELGPCLFARLLLSHILKINPTMLAIIRGRDVDVRGDDQGAPPPSSPEGSTKQLQPNPADVKKLWKNPWLIPDERLVREVVACIEADEAYTPLAERVRQYVFLFFVLVSLVLSWFN